MPTDNPLADPTRREELRKKLGVYGMQSLTLQEFYLYFEEALRLLDEQDRRIEKLQADHRFVMSLASDHRDELEATITSLRTRVEALEAERDALRGLVREGYGITSWLT